MFEKVQPNTELVAGEHEVLDLWEKTQAFDKLRKQLAGKPRFSFLDGPITANNPMGVHHAWGRTYKDIYQRFHAMTGHDQRWQNGFDCQGLWVEVEVEKEHKFNTKRDIEEYGLEKFINDCKSRVLKYAAVQTDQSVRLGMWMDWDNSYFTMSPENNYTIWSFLKRCHERGFIYKGLDAMPWCPRCGTGISEQERKEGYKQVEDDAVYLKFPLRDRPGEFLLVWTTTPWTLAANVAAAVNPEMTYLKVSQSEEIYYIAKSRLSILESEKKVRGEPQVLAQLTGEEMVGWEFEGPFDELPAAGAARPAHKVIPFAEVTETEGTGIVHIAPGCGKEDFELSKVFDLPVVAPIDDSGLYVKGFGAFEGLAAQEVTSMVFASLKEKGLFYKREKYLHDYPHCWRCHTPLLFRAVDEWYIDMGWRDEIADVVRQINWIPEYFEDLELDWLKNMGDWMISKKRYWGLALPIFECNECGWFDVIGSREELQERSVAGWDSFVGDPDDPNTPHRPWIDDVRITCGGCGAKVARILDVGNPWLDAGIVPYSTVHYNTDRAHFQKWIPADFVVESFPGQFRNWFYALLAMSTMMEKIPPFKTLFGYALVRNERGEEMHKSLGNSIDFDEAADTMSADVMRWMYMRQSPTQNLHFGYKAGEQIRRKIFGTLWNTYLFFTNYALLDEFDPSAPKVPVKDRPEMDRWILSDLQALTEMAHEQFSTFWVYPFMRKAEAFIDQLSNWYVRRNRRRFWDPKGKDPQDKLAAYQTLHEVLVSLIKLLAPVIPFVTERMYQNLVVNVDPDPPCSIHLTSYPEVDPALVDLDLSFQMQITQQVVGTTHALREKAMQRVRQPLAKMIVASHDANKRSAIAKLSGVICDELNVKGIEVVEDLGGLTTVSAAPNFAALGPRFGKRSQEVGAKIRELSEAQVRVLAAGGNTDASGDEITPQDVAIHVATQPGWEVGEAGDVQIALDVRLDDALIAEGYARDVVRHVQQLRADAGLNIEDHITLSWETADPDLAAAIENWMDYIKAETQADTAVRGISNGTSREVELGDKPVKVAISKI